jgi:hypothetical protein
MHRFLYSLSQPKGGRMATPARGVSIMEPEHRGDNFKEGIIRFMGRSSSAGSERNGNGSASLASRIGEAATPKRCFTALFTVCSLFVILALLELILPGGTGRKLVNLSCNGIAAANDNTSTVEVFRNLTGEFLKEMVRKGTKTRETGEIYPTPQPQTAPLQPPPSQIEQEYEETVDQQPSSASTTVAPLSGLVSSVRERFWPPEPWNPPKSQTEEQ